MEVPRKRFFRRVRMGEEEGEGWVVVDWWRMWVGWDNGVLEMGLGG